MKVGRVSQVVKISGREAKDNAKRPAVVRPFRSEPVLEMDGKLNADQEGYDERDSKPQGSRPVGYRLVSQPVEMPHEAEPAGGTTDDLLHEFLEKLRNAYRLNLRF